MFLSLNFLESEGEKMFEINIINQYWLGEEIHDLCSHGELYIKVGDVMITNSGRDEEWGISTSALTLLRTLYEEPSFTYQEIDPERDEPLITHCGNVSSPGCPISIYWGVQHMEGEIILSNFVKFTTTSYKEGVVDYKGLKVKISKEEYREEIVVFALEVKAFFEQSQKKIIEDEDERESYKAFWEEYNTLLEKAHSA
ncbi:hypothetical protein [Priestia endophytica]|uniref:hypothetical protein n=1 Tax=Priestia endophytica TaxID=135735 RepID=UPI00227EED5A|nr:hypothetical protein [Priestia endophytica]MCY8235477.1 hypothetical protein [Priestia endophytica]